MARAVPADLWPADGAGVVTLPSGRRVRGRGLREGDPPADAPSPSFGLYLLGKPPPATPWEARWVEWPDFRLPRDRSDAGAAFREVWTRAATERICGDHVDHNAKST